ncbi:MAG: T9SS type A sorting domain-containing protein [Parafilimonas sp.]
MNKTFTLKFFNYLSKTLLVAVIVFGSAFLQSNTANSANMPGRDIQARMVKCYPNPAISFINFEILPEYITKNYSLQVYSFTGKKMYEVNINFSKVTLTFTNEFYRGIYVYQLQDKNGKVLETGKFQVNK